MLRYMDNTDMRKIITRVFSPPSHRFLLAFLVCLGVALRMASAFYAPFTIDEAYSLANYAKLDSSRIITSYDIPNNHILNNLLTHYLSQISLHWFVLRFPALVGALVFLWFFYLLLLRYYSPFVSILSISVLALHPYVLALSVSSRGYGMAMGFLIAGIYFGVKAIESGGLGPILVQSLCFLISALSIPSFIIGVALVYLGQIICFAIRRHRWQAFVLSIVSAEIIAALTYQIYFLRLSQQGSWAMHVFGTSSLMDALGEMTYLITNRNLMGFISTNQLLGVLAIVLVCSIAIRPNRQPVSFIIRLVAIGAPPVFYLAHLVLGMNFPQSRAWVFFFIFLVPSFFESIEFLAKWVSIDRMLAKWPPVTGMVTCMIALGIVHPELSTYQMRIIGQPEAAEYSVGLGDLLLKATQEQPSPPPHICINAWYDDIVRYYQRAWKLDLKVDCNPDTSNFLIINRNSKDISDFVSLHLVRERTDRLLGRDDLSGLTLYSVKSTPRPLR